MTFEKISLIYCGKKVKKKGTKKDGSEYKLYDIEMRQDPNSQYPVRASVFDSIKGIDLLNEDNEGEVLTFNCKLEEYTNSYGKQMSRNIIEVTFDKEAQISDKITTKADFFESDQKQEIPKKIPKVCRIDNYVECYINEMQNAGKENVISESHCLLGYIKLLSMHNFIDKFLNKDLIKMSKKFKTEFDKYIDKDLGVVGTK